MDITRQYIRKFINEGMDQSYEDLSREFDKIRDSINLDTGDEFRIVAKYMCNSVTCKNPYTMDIENKTETDLCFGVLLLENLGSSWYWSLAFPETAPANLDKDGKGDSLEECLDQLRAYIQRTFEEFVVEL